jgi:hypothetical protein
MANDDVILELKKRIDEKKKALKGAEKFSPITNCSLELGAQRFNIQVSGKEQLTDLLVMLNAYRNSAIELEVNAEYRISGYSLDDWITDIKARLMNLNRNIEQGKLKSLEDKLDSLLSSEKRVELELEDIKNLLK